MTNQEIVPRQSMVVSIERLKGIITFLCVYGICRTIGQLYHIYIHCAVSMSMSCSIVVYPNNGYYSECYSNGPSVFRKYTRFLCHPPLYNDDDNEDDHDGKHASNSK